MPKYEATESRFDAFIWDEDKRALNLRKHRIDFADVDSGLFRRHIRMASPRGAEMRYKAVGRLEGREIAIVYTEREEGRVCRIISARPAHEEEKAAYRQIHS